MIHYRDAEPQDGPALGAMAAQSFCDTFAHLYSDATLESFLKETFGPMGLPAQIGDPSYRIRVALDGETIAGFAKIGANTLASPPVAPGAAELKQLYVATGHHGSGIAAALMQWAIDALREQGATHLALSVFSENIRAQRFYARYGLREIGTNRFKVGDQYDDDRIWSVAL